MKFTRSCFAAAVLAASAPAFAVTTPTLTFEGVTSFLSVADYYLNVGADFGVQFGLDAIAVSNDGTGSVTPANPDGNFYSHAPSSGTVLQVAPNGGTDVAFLTPRAGLFFVDEVSFYYSTSKSSLDAVQFFSGANGSAELLGALSLSKNATLLCNDSPYCNWQRISLTFPGLAQSIMIRSNGGETAFDNFTLTTAVPEPETYAMPLAGLAALGWVAKRQQRR